jgi:two-component system, NtrC family, sensor kinase
VTGGADGPPPPPGDPSGIDEALLGRPSLGIRTRLGLGYLSFLVLTVGVTIAAWVLLTRLEEKLRFLELADHYTMEIQQARRFEKNFFLYHTNLPEVKEHLSNARDLLGALNPLLEPGEQRRMQALLANYQKLVDDLVTMESRKGPQNQDGYTGIEADMRHQGSQMVAVALDLAEKERRSVNGSIALFKRLPVAVLVVLLLVAVVTANFLARQMLGPLGRLLASTQRIAEGDFTPVAPTRRYRDEFSNFAVALNTMMRELARRQEVLVQSHKLSAVGTLTAGVAHELNNPINNITLTAEMLREDYRTLSDEERLDMVNDLVEQAGRAQRTVRNLLDFARESEITSQRIDLGELLSRTASLAANQIKLSGAKITVEVPPNLPPIHGDAQSLSQVLVNLLLNALDAVGKGGHVRIAANATKEKGFVLVTVSDDGHGIPAHVLPKIFDPFFTTKVRGRGTGLGLSVSLGIVRQHGGDIRVESTPGIGTTFTVLLPAAMVPAGGDRNVAKPLLQPLPRA